MLDTTRTRPYGPRAFSPVLAFRRRPARARMAEHDPDSRRLAELQERLQKARGNEKEAAQPERPQSQLGIAFRLVTELLAAVIVGGGIGWALDRIFATSPVLLIVMFLLGIAAGMRNVMRTAREMNESQSGPRG